MRVRAVRRSPGVLGDQDGVVLAELVMALTMLVMLAVGGVELGRYVLISQKLDRVASTVADLAARADTLSEANIADILSAAAQIIAPFQLGAGGVVILSSITRNGTNPPQINWQRFGGGTLSQASNIGVEGGDATMPNGMAVASGETVIVAEVYYSYLPWPLEGVSSPTLLYQTSLYRPRFGGLTAVLP